MLKLPSKRFAVITILILLPILYFYPAVIGKAGLLDGDGWNYALGLRILVARMAASWTLPLWNPYTFGGMPLLATVQVGALYPLNWLFAIFPAGAATKIMQIGNFHLALTGAYLYARSIELNRVSALITGIIFAFGGFMMAHIEPTNIIATAVYLPWILLAIERLRQQVNWRWIVLGSLFLTLQIIAGHPQPTFYSFLVATAYAVFSLFARAEPKQRRRFAAALAMVAVCGLLLSAVQWLPAMELQRQGERAQVSYEFFSGFAMPPRRLLTLIFPFFFGGYAQPPYRIPFWDSWWETKWVCGYAGLLGLLLGLIALLRARRNRLVWFWAGVAAVSLGLAMGPHLPFGINSLLYRIPGLNLFRCSYRHLYEFSFALAALAGIGANSLARLEPQQAKRTARRAALLLTALVAGTTLMYCFSLNRLGTLTPPPVNAGSLANAEAYLPLIFFVLSLAALWFYVWVRSASSVHHRESPVDSGNVPRQTRTLEAMRTHLAGAGLIAVLLLDLASFGHFMYWRTLDPHIVDRLADSATTRYIKSREADLNVFRVMCQTKGNNPDLLNSPNISIARELQVLNGYDPMRLSEFADLAGQVNEFGVAQDLSTYTLADQGLNLLNAKYLLYERGGRPDHKYDGIGFGQLEMNLALKPGVREEITPNGVMATELAIVSMLGNSTHLAEGTPVVQVRLHLKDGPIVEREIQAGRDTSEWAYDRADVKAVIKHQRARIAENFDAEGFQAHRYLARLAFERAEVVRIEFNYVCPDAGLYIARASLHDATTGISTPLDRLALPPERWRRLESFGEVDVYENLKAMPRAWFVSRLIQKPRAEVLRAIKEGRMADGTSFDPAQTALLETEAQTLPSLMGNAADAQVKVTNYQPQRIEMETSNPKWQQGQQGQQGGFLVLSEIYYPGWEAEVDGKPTEIYRTNYNLRGVSVPPGNHRVVFTYRPSSFRRGILCAAIGVALLLAGAGFQRRQKRA